MEEAGRDDYDLFFLQIKGQLSENGQVKAAKEDMDFGMGFHLGIPDIFHLAERNEAEKIFWTKNRPPIILLTDNQRVGITFQAVPDWEGRKVSECGEELCRLLERMDSRTVFYDSGTGGNEVKVFWLEYKSFAKRKRVYNIAFLFAIGEKRILGTFFSPFEEYGQWKKEILELFETIREGE